MAHQNLHQLAQGVYQICSVISDTVAEVSLDDRKSVKCCPVRGMLNQQWEVKPLGNGYSICSVLNGHYLTVEKGAHDGAHIIATPYPVSWSVEPFDLERDSWVIAWPNAPFVFYLDLDGGKPGETIHLCPRRPEEYRQRWRFVPYQAKPPEKSTGASKNAVVRTPTSTTSGTKIHVTDHGAGTQNLINSPATSTVETIVDSSDWSGVGGSGNLTITTVTTSIMKLATRYSTKPEDGKMYKIINVKAKCVIDLNGTDNISVIGHIDHGGPNQKWLLERTGSHWTLRSAWDARYIGIDARPEEGTCLIAVDRPFEWDIWPDERNKSAYRIFVPNAPAPGLNFDLSQEYGKPDLGIPIILWKKDEAELGQVWKFEEV